MNIEIRETSTYSTSFEKKKTSKVTDPMMTPFEYAKLLQIDAVRIRKGGELKIDDWTGPFDPIAIAKCEIEQRVAPYEIVRKIPDGTKELGYYEEVWDIKHMDIRDC